MTLNQLINGLVSIALVEMMLTIGVSATWNELVGVAKNWRLMLGVLVANYIFVPAATLGLLQFFHARPLPAAGFLILAACPGAPYGPLITAFAKGNLPLAVGLMAVLAATSAVLAPVLLQFLIPLVARQEPVRVESVKLLQTLVITQLAPLGCGILLRQCLPNVVIRVQAWGNRIGLLLNLLAVGLVLATQSALFSAVPLRALAGMAALLIVCLTIGWKMGGKTPEHRKTVALVTALRNVGLGLVIATSAFPGTAAVTAVLAYGLFEITGAFLLAAWWRRPTPVINCLRVT